MEKTETGKRFLLSIFSLPLLFTVLHFLFGKKRREEKRKTENVFGFPLSVFHFSFSVSCFVFRKTKTE